MGRGGRGKSGKRGNGLSMVDSRSRARKPIVVEVEGSSGVEVSRSDNRCVDDSTINVVSRCLDGRYVERELKRYEGGEGCRLIDFYRCLLLLGSFRVCFLE